ncbi:MAG: hypothetical protein KME32_30515 [Mojavia pulchra JT2-VF2]|jgi:hypothetical protein|uniref:Uncharacterized protein n=1 Tax=Mojavia pulchra JT2-VF2 TaxID=287848 RepID=A0A951Q3L0_9NOST|nr:hypothetical protein [Mojavia pulchra JT2-VF2]
MQSPETQTTNFESTAPLSKDTTSDIKHESKTEPMTQVQADSVLTREQLPNKGFRIALTLVTSVILLSVAAIYFGIIHP